MEPLIEAVRKYPCLWNTTAIEYRDQELKDAAWAEVMKETDLSSVKEVKLKWKKLRDSYRDALKRQSEMAAKEPANAKKNYPWKYMGLMQFLQPHMSVRKKPADTLPGLGPSSAGPPATNGDAHSSDSSESEAESAPAASTRPRRASGERLAAIDRKLDVLCRAAGGKRPCPDRREFPDPLDIFFNSMCQWTKRLPYPAQINIKKTLFGAVVAAEEALLAEQQSYAALWARAPSRSSSDPEPDTDDRKPA